MLNNIIVLDEVFLLVKPTTVDNKKFVVKYIPLGLIQQVEVFSHFDSFVDLLLQGLLFGFEDVMSSLFEQVIEVGIIWVLFGPLNACYLAC